MSLVAGNVGSKTVLPDGVQVDHISENTVGHGVSVAGRTNGVAIEPGIIGEKIGMSIQPSSVIPTDTTASDWANATITLGKGRWLILMSTFGNVGTSTTSGSYYSQIQMTNSSNTVVDNCKAELRVTGLSAAGNIVGGGVSFSTVQDITVEGTVFKLRVVKESGTNSITAFYGTELKFYAVRIA